MIYGLGFFWPDTPAKYEAEQSVLGAILLTKKFCSSVTEIISSQDFYREDHREIFEAIMDLYEKGEPIDLITVAEQLKVRGSLEAVGGLSILRIWQVWFLPLQMQNIMQK